LKFWNEAAERGQQQMRRLLPAVSIIRESNRPWIWTTMTTLMYSNSITITVFKKKGN
jgi:hypothetical protein